MTNRAKELARIVDDEFGVSERNRGGKGLNSGKVGYRLNKEEVQLNKWGYKVSDDLSSISLLSINIEDFTLAENPSLYTEGAVKPFKSKGW